VDDYEARVKAEKDQNVRNRTFFDGNRNN